MGHVYHQRAADRRRDLGKLGMVDLPGVGRAASEDQLGAMLTGERLDLVEVDQRVFLAHAIMDRVEPLAGHVGRRAVRQMAAGIEAQAHDRVARPDEREEHRLIGLAAGVGLHIGIAAAEQARGPLDRKVFRDVHELAAAIVALAGIAFGVFVRQRRADRLQHGARDDVLRGNQFDFLALTLQLQPDGPRELGVCLAERRGKEPGVRVGEGLVIRPEIADCHIALLGAISGGRGGLHV